MSLVATADIRAAVRGMRREPVVAAAAILCLAFGLGATAAISSAVDRALLLPLPFRDSGRLVSVYRTTPQSNTFPFSAPNYLDLARSAGELSDLAAAAANVSLLALRDQSLMVPVYRVTGNLFPMLGVHALRGRLLTPSDDAPGAPAVAVLSEELWRDRLGAADSIVGRTVRLDGQPTTIVGVLPTGERPVFGSRGFSAQLYVPMHFTPQELGSRGRNFLVALGRLAPGASAAQAQSQLRTVYAGLARSYPDMEGESVRVVPLEADVRGPVRAPLLLMLGAGVLVLLIAATNVASLLLARGVERRRETAIRAALGGDAWAVTRPVILESLAVALVGGLAGLLLAWIAIRTIGTLAAARLPQLAGLTLDPRVVAFALALAVLVALVAAALPAWRGASVNPQEALRGGTGGGQGREQHGVLRVLVVAELALSMVLLLGAGLVLRGFVGLTRQDPGFDPKPILTMSVTVSPQRYPGATSVQQFLEPALERINALPGVAGAAAISDLPYRSWGSNFNIRYEGRPFTDWTHLPLAEIRAVTPGFFAVTGQRLLEGRLLRASDDERTQSRRVVVVNQALVRRDLPGQDPVGQRFYWESSFATIVGVVSDIRNDGPFSPPQPEVYWTYRQGAADFGPITSFPIVVRVARGGPEQAARPVLAAIRAVDPGAAVSRVEPMTSVIAQSLGRPRFYLTLLGVFAGVALLLAMAGLYGVMSYAVAQRSRELGIRTALGGTRSTLLALVVRQGMTLVAVGVGIGLVAGAALTRLLTGLLYGVSPLDPAAWAGVTVALALAGLVATLLPAARATRVDPMLAIRAE